MIKYEQETTPLSPYHQIFYNEQQLNPKRFDYNIAFIQRINGRIDVERLKNAIKLFTSNTYLYRCIIREEFTSCFWEDSGLPPELEIFETVTKYNIQKYIKKGFKLGIEPACRFALFINEPTDYIFVAVIHHILIDGLKFDKLISTLSNLYNNADSSDFEPLEVQRKALINTLKFQDVKELSREFWQNRLNNLPKGERILGDTPGNHRYRVNALDFSISKEDYYCWKSNLKFPLSDFNIILTIFGILVTKYNLGSEFPVTYPVAIEKTDNLKLGSTINTVITCFAIKKGMTFEGLLLQKKKDIKDELTHARLPIYEAIHFLSGIKLSVSLAQTNLKQTLLKIDGCETSILNKDYYYDIGGNDLVLEFDNSDKANINFRIKYREKYSATFIKNFFNCFRHLMQLCLENLQLEIMNISLLSPKEYKKIIYDFNPPAYKFEAGNTIQEVFEKIVQQMPEKLACCFGSTQLTYGELNKKANQLAHYLVNVGQNQASLIAICMKRSTHMIIAMLGILKAGAAYVPLDCDYPEERIKLILDNSNCKIILTDNEPFEMKSLFAHLCVINLATNNEIPKQSNINLPNKGYQRDLAYVIYTSGTTGTPKGVLIEHGGVIRLVKNRLHYQLIESDCFLQASSISFDAATFEIWGALLNGATLDLLEDQTILGDAGLFKDYLFKKKITILWLTVGLFNQLASQDNKIFSNIRNLIIGGDALSLSVINALVSLPEAYKPMKILNGYGPTENTTFTTLYSIEKPIISLTSIPIGSPLPGTTCYILDSNLNPVPIGAVGELYIGGQALARGYLNNLELNKAAFVPNPFLVENKAMLYKTGDLVRWLADGNIEFIGRNDNQIKIRGFRVELREIEAYLMRLNQIDQCAVVVFSLANSADKHIIAYYRVKDSHTTTKGKIKEFLLKHLPSFMIPTYFYRLDRMPLTANGKLDISQLPVPTADERLPSSLSAVASHGDELIIKQIFEEVLQQNEISPLICILDLGAHSLHLLRIAAKIQKAFDINCSINMIMTAQTIKELAGEISCQLKAKNNDYLLTRASKHRQRYPLSFEQKRLWFLAKYTGKSCLYNILTVFRITGALDSNILERAIAFLTTRHQALRTRLNEDSKGRPYQVAANNDCKTYLVQHKDTREADLEAIFFRESSYEFDLTSGQLFKAKLYQIRGRDEYFFITNMHHIISDAWSLKIFFKELSDVYNALKINNEPKLSAIEVQYADYAIWQKNISKSQKWDSQIEYWKNKLADYKNIPLPIKAERPANLTYDGLHHHFELDKKLIDDLQKFTRRHHCTLHILLMTAFYVLLHSYSGEDDLIIGIPVTNRDHYQLENIIGFFVNLLPIRITNSNTLTKKSLLQQIKLTCSEAYSNQIPFDYLINELKIGRDQSMSPLFQVMFNLVQDNEIKLNFDGAAIENVQYDSQVAKYDLTLSLFVDDNKIVGNFEFNTNLFDLTFIERMATHYTRILADFLQNDEDVFNIKNMLTKDEMKLMLSKWNETYASYDKSLTIDKIFNSIVVSQPNAIAVKFNDHQLTYAELNNKSTMIANYLRFTYLKQTDRELSPNSLIAIYMDRSLELAIAIFAIIKAGCGYIPIGIDYPQERINLIIKDTKPKFIISSHSHANKLNNIIYDINNVVCIEKIDLKNNRDNYCNFALDTCKPNNLAYVLYTSGTTGGPKGVPISHLNLINLITSFSKKIPLAPDKKFLSLTAYTFDIFNLEFFGSLCFGAQLVLTDSKVIKDPASLSDFINGHRPDIVQATPSLWQLIIDQLSPSPHLHILIGGETLYPGLLEKFFRVSKTVWNLYGPTETTIWSTAKKLSEGQKISIGKPICNTKIFILDKNREPVPIGVYGEIHIGGDGVARGYLNNPSLTLKNFIEIAVGSLKVYKTGDFARWLESGEIEFLGRKDFQVKVRGYRIELKEIEEQLLLHPDIKQCAVVLNNNMNHDSKSLVAYFTSFNSVDPLVLKKYLTKRIPSYLIPDILVPLKKMPLTQNGKIDRNSLANKRLRSSLIINRAKPRTNVEKILTEIYGSILGLDEVGINDNFFDIGGHSLNAIQLLTKINRAFDTDLTLKIIFDFGRVSDLAKHIESQKNIQIF